MKRVLIYARCSTRDQETENQVAQLRDYAAKQGWEVADPVVDVCSGGKAATERPGLDKVFDLARRRKFDLLLFWALDRFSREGSRKTIGYLAMLDDAGVDWHSFSEPYISSLGIFKDAIIAILSALAKQEKVRISERTKAGLERTVRVNGTRLGRPWTPAERIRKAKALELIATRVRNATPESAPTAKQGENVLQNVLQAVPEAKKTCDAVVASPSISTT